MTTVQELYAIFGAVAPNYTVMVKLEGEYVIVEDRKLRAGREPEGAGIEVR